MIKAMLLTMALMPPTTFAKQVANLNVSLSEAASYGCDSTCYGNFQAGLADDMTLYGSLFDEDFYTTASNFSHLTSSPGDVLKLEPVNMTTHTDIPFGTTAFKFQYVTQHTKEEDKSTDIMTPATAFIAFPFANRTGGHSYNTIALAHGTSGIFRGCAPSAMPNLYDYDSWTQFIKRGYAVVATDYTGLGVSNSNNNETMMPTHPYTESRTLANDVYYSMVAARKLFGSEYLTSDWLAVGHSEGGGVAWALAESSLVQHHHGGHDEEEEEEDKGLNYLGTVALAPAVRLGDMAQFATEGLLNTEGDGGIGSSRGILGELGWVALALETTLAPGRFPLSSWVQPTFRKRLELAARAQACYSSMTALVGDLRVDEVLNIDGNSTALGEVLEFIQDMTLAGERSSDRPILVVQGSADVSVIPEVVYKTFGISCRFGNEVHLQNYAGLGHDGILEGGAPAILDWIDERFMGLPTSGVCSNETVRGFNEGLMNTVGDE